MKKNLHQLVVIFCCVLLLGKAFGGEILEKDESLSPRAELLAEAAISDEIPPNTSQTHGIHNELLSILENPSSPEEFHLLHRILAASGVGYASGSSSVMWIFARSNEDYPYSCKCDPGGLSQYKKGGVPPKKPKSSPAWYKKAIGYISGSGVGDLPGVPCSGTSSQALISSGSPNCDSINAASGRAGSLSVGAAAALAICYMVAT